MRQPWAWAIIHGGKDVENRTRNLAGGYRGPVAIHAGLSPDIEALGDPQIVEAMRTHDTTAGSGLWWRGLILGVVDLVDVHVAHPEQHAFADVYSAACCSSPWAVMGWLDSSDPVHHLVLANPRPLQVPVPARGMLGLWTTPPAVLEQLQAVV